ncbi:hypothetical protein CJ030_MR2G005630 [Morella rubra]|uniref:Uncharacterized protein n=1 Tax=Morella rubra TaxID=262757 RepID=A0A6A1W826_9ROSI|nr:hypothetical protein CJ030_MR2G005630 [Morella rubra]
MKRLKAMSEAAWKYLDDVDPKLWSRHAFGWACKSDMVFNKLAECFNSWTKEARDKPIITMLEMIRQRLMVRFRQKREGAEAALRSGMMFCPKILKKLERSKSEASHCRCSQSGMQFEVDHYDAARWLQFEVDHMTMRGQWWT